jgi:hypothetical protein
MAREIKTDTVIKPYSEFDETNDDLIVIGLEFDAETPYMVVSSNSDFQMEEFYSVPKQMAYYAATHRGFTTEGRKHHDYLAKRELANQIKSLLEIK